MNHNHVLTDGDNIVVIPTTLPYVQLYDSMGQFIKKINLDKAKFYKKNLSHIMNQADFHEDNVSYVLNVDAYLCGDNIYVLCSRFKNNYKSDRILVVDLKQDALKKVLLLPESNYGALCFDGKRFYVFNKSCCSIDVLEEE